MIKNGKYFLRPEKNGSDFKELFRHLASSGAGRPVDSDGFPEGPWTPDLLAAAITELDPSGAGIELRTVQLWFQDNDKGISSDNIRWLARIFGCDDPEATSEWQAELSAARTNFIAKRREKRSPKEHSEPDAPLPPSSQVLDAQRIAIVEPNDSVETQRSKPRFGLARASEAMFGGSPLNLPASVFAGAVALGFTSYFLGIHEATFDAPDGHMKQVGFLWAPNWTFLFMAFMPMFFAFVSELLFFWKNEGRHRVAGHGDLDDGADAWTRNIEASTYTFWAVLLICLLFAGLFQWVGVRLLPLMRGGGDYATDWGSLAIMRPEVISVPEAITFTGLAYLYMCICFYLFFAALILLYSVAQDFGHAQASSTSLTGAEHQNDVNLVGVRVMSGIFRCTVLAIFVAVCMKLQSAYLASSATDILQWLSSDIASIVTAADKSGSLGDFSAPNHFSSLLIVLASVFVFLYGAFRLDVGGRNRIAVWIMSATVGLLVAGYLMIGAFAGFSALLGMGVVLGLYALIVPGFRTEKRHELRDEQSVS